MKPEYIEQINKALELIQQEIDDKNRHIEELKQEIKEMQARYNTLLIFGVTANNERLKGL